MTVVERIRADFAAVVLASETKKNLRKRATGRQELLARRNLEYRSFGFRLWFWGNVVKRGGSGSENVECRIWGFTRGVVPGLN